MASGSYHLSEMEQTSTQGTDGIRDASAFLFNPLFWSLFTGMDPVLCIQGSTIRLSPMYVTLLAGSGSVREKYQDGNKVSYLSQPVDTEEVIVYHPEPWHHFL